MDSVQKLPLKKMAEKIFPGNYFLKPRSLFETTKPQKQCEAVIDPLTPETKCWICGLTGGKFVCEHVLPIAQAKYFLDLYSKDTPVSLDMLKLEYEWAHDVCNASKGALVLIKLEKKPANFYSPDEKNILILLSRIQKKLNIQDANWIKERKYYITNRIQQIANFVNRPGFENLAVLANSSTLHAIKKRGGKRTYKTKRYKK